MRQPKTAVPRFWRDPALPFIEARHVADGRQVCYDKHTHETFSIGAITGGRSIYVNERTRENVGAGATVIINPGEVHACAAVGDQSWSYHMLYLDVDWLHTQIGFHPFEQKLSSDPALYAGLDDLYRQLTDDDLEPFAKESALIGYLAAIQAIFAGETTTPPKNHRLENTRLQRAADFIAENCTRALRLEEICAASDLSPSYLVRAFKQRFGLTPHTYLMDRRVQRAKAQLRRGQAIVDVALECGFADQPHFQRMFKRVVAATPRQYAGA